MKLFASLVAVLFLSACGAKGTATTSTPAPSTPTVTITQQPANTTVMAGQAATFTVGAVASPADATLSYSWTLTSPGSNSATSVGENSPTFTIDNTSIAQSGSSVQVAISVVSDAPAVSSPATLVVENAASGSGLYATNQLMLPPNTTSGQYFSHTFPTLPPGVVTVCYLTNNSQMAAFDSNPTTDVTDGLGDSFQLATSQANGGSIEQGCFVGRTLGGANVAVQFNTQNAAGLDSGAVIAVALVYQGVSAFDAAGSFSIPFNGSGAQTAPIVCNQPNEIVVALSTVLAPSFASAGSDWTNRFAVDGAYLGGFLVEDGSSPTSPLPNTTQVPFYLTYVSGDPTSFESVVTLY